MRRRFVFGAVVFAGVALTMVSLVGALVGALLRRADGAPGPLVAAVVTLSLFLIVGRLTVRWARPVSGVVEAADRVAEGDLAARAPTSGPRTVRRLGRSFNTMAERLENDDERRRQLLADIAHELRTPLSVVRGNLEGLLDGVYEPDEARIERVLAEVGQIERLLNDLRTLSNADAGVLALELEEVSLQALTQRVADAHRPRATSLGVAIDVTVGPTVPTVTADPGRLEQVVGNLFDNAMRHGGGVTRVHAALRHDGATKEVVLEVHDDGDGIDEDVLPHVFDRMSGSSDADGTGLGLPIAQRLIARHGGTIEITCPPGGGTTVEVRLPVG